MGLKETFPHFSLSRANSLGAQPEAPLALAQLVALLFTDYEVGAPSFLSFYICYILNSSNFCKLCLQNLEELEWRKYQIKEGRSQPEKFTPQLLYSSPHSLLTKYANEVCSQLFFVYLFFPTLSQLLSCKYYILKVKLTRQKARKGKGRENYKLCSCPLFYYI